MSMSFAATLLEGYNGYSSTETIINDPIGYMNEACIECITGLYEASEQFYTGDIIGQTQVLMEGSDPKQKIKELWEGFKKKIGEILAKFISKFRNVISSFKKKSLDRGNDLDKLRKLADSVDESSSISMLDMMDEFIDIDEFSDDLLGKLTSDDIWGVVCASDVIGDIADTLEHFNNADASGTDVSISPDDIKQGDWKSIFGNENGKSFDEYKTELENKRAMFNKLDKNTSLNISTVRKLLNRVDGISKDNAKTIKHLESAINVLSRWKKDLSDPSFLKNLDGYEQSIISALQHRVVTSLDYYTQVTSIYNIRSSSIDMLLFQLGLGLKDIQTS